VFTVILTLLVSGPMAAQQEAESSEAFIDSLIKQLTIEEKVALCHGHALFSSPGVERLGIPELQMLDGPHGIRPELKRHSWDHAGWTTDSATAFPSLTCLAATFDPDLALRYGQALGAEARYRKKDVLLAPGVNIYRSPLNGRNFEYMGEDPLLAGTMAVSYIQGVQANGVAACVKHFALNNQEIGRHHINVEVTDRALHEIYLPAFKRAVQEGGVWTLMGAYNKYENTHCCHNNYLLNDILKNEWGFDGVVISDWGGTHNSREAILNGLDIEMGSNASYDRYYMAKPFLKLLGENEVAESVLDDKVRRILRLMTRTTLSDERSEGAMTTPEHVRTAYDVASAGMVLLKNDGAFFPLNPDLEMTIAVIGENATRPMAAGGGSAELKAKYEVSPLEGIQEKFPRARIKYAQGYKAHAPAEKQMPKWKSENKKLRMEAIQKANGADVVLFIGGLNKNKEQDHEDSDRNSLELPFQQDKLIDELLDLNPRTGVILVSGNAVGMPWIHEAPAVLQAWYGGSEAGNALADILCGNVNPSGKLPFTFPVELTDNAAHHFGSTSYPGNGTEVQYKEDILVGYRWHETKAIKPLFAFGHGLSYTSFELTEAQTERKNYGSGDTIRLRVKVANTGERSGTETVQAYIGKPTSSVKRAIKELKGFEKVFLEPNEQAAAEFSISINDLAYYDEDLAEWKLEKGDYIIYVGNASDNISKEVMITVE